jgi:PilZ domain
MQTNIDSPKECGVAPDRRRHPRYRFSTPITVTSTDGVAMPGIGIEISESGMSAITADSLQVNDRVQLEPVAGGKALASVRRIIGRVSGFEFFNLSAEQAQRIRENCKVLPLYQGKSLGI